MRDVGWYRPVAASAGAALVAFAVVVGFGLIAGPSATVIKVVVSGAADGQGAQPVLVCLTPGPGWTIKDPATDEHGCVGKPVADPNADIVFTVAKSPGGGG